MHHNKMITDLHHAKKDKRQPRRIQRVDDPPDFSSRNNRRKSQQKSVHKIPESMPQISQFIETSSSLIFDKRQFNSTEPENFITFLSTYLHHRKVSIENSLIDNNHLTLSFMTQLSGTTPHSFVETIYHSQPPYLCTIYRH